jgi:ribosomal protein S18 acetylase RimI-like enzyme
VTLEIRPASSLDSEQLASLFTAGFSGYYVPIAADAAAIEAMTSNWDFDLDASRVAFDDGEPVGFAFLGVRGPRGWIGGTGVVPAARRRGIGDAVMRAVLDEAARLGLEEVSLEVLVQNEPALRLYERLGFEHVRELEIWEVEASNDVLLDSGSARNVAVESAQEAIARLRREPEPWQRADEIVARLADVRALAVEDGAVLYRTSGGRASIVQLAGSADAARELLAAILAEVPAVAWVNAPAGDPPTEACAALGGRVTERQIEMRRGTPFVPK